MADVGGPLLFVRRGEVVADTGPAYVEAELERPSFEIIDIIVGWNLRVPGKEIPCGIDCIELELGAEFEQVEQGGSGSPSLELVVQCLAEGVGVQAGLELGAANPLDRRRGAGVRAAAPEPNAQEAPAGKSEPRAMNSLRLTGFSTA